MNRNFDVFLTSLHFFSFTVNKNDAEEIEEVDIGSAVNEMKTNYRGTEISQMESL